MSSQIADGLFYSPDSVSVTAWCFAVASIVKSCSEADEYMALVEQTFKHPHVIDFARLKESARLMAEYSLCTYNHGNDFISMPLFISIRASEYPFGIEVNFNPRAKYLLLNLKSFILDLNDHGMLTPQSLLGRINALKYPIGSSSFGLRMDVYMQDMLNADPAFYTIHTRAQLDEEDRKFDESMARVKIKPVRVPVRVKDKHAD